MLRIFIFLNCFFFLSIALADSDVTIEGLRRTDPSVIYTELALCNCLDRPDDVEQVILATGLFYDVQTTSENGRVNAIKLKEKWTTIPILKFNSGGGVLQTTVGVYDPNVWGRRIELGSQYESLAGAPSVVFWNKIPRWLESRFFTDLQIWKTQRTRLKYDPTTNDPVLIKALLQKSNRNYVALGYELNSLLKTRLGFETQSDSFSTDRIPTETLKQVSGQTVPSETEVHLLSGQIDYGKLKIERHSPIGLLTSVNYKLGFEQSNNQSRFESLRLESSYFKLTNDFLFAGRFQLGSTNTELIQYWNYLGGFESIRGFVDNRFATKNYWLLNLESRYYMLEKEKYVIQSSSFLDLIGIDEQKNELQNAHAASFGIGARIILPYFYRLTIRFDYAVPIIKSDNQSFSFGVQQFF